MCQAAEGVTTHLEGFGVHRYRLCLYADGWVWVPAGGLALLAAAQGTEEVLGGQGCQADAGQVVDSAAAIAAHHISTLHTCLDQAGSGFARRGNNRTVLCV